MKLTSWYILGSLFFSHVSSQLVSHKPDYSTHHYYVVEHIPKASASINEVAAALDVELLNQIGPLENFWLVRVPKSHKRNAQDVLQRYAELNILANEHLNRRSFESLHAKHIVSSTSALFFQSLRQRVKREAIYTERAPPSRPSIEVDPSANVIATRLGIKDPIFHDQWHIVNEEYPQNTMNVTSVWENMGLTGKGVYVAMVDDGLDYTHSDLKENFVRMGRVYEGLSITQNSVRRGII